MAEYRMPGVYVDETQYPDRAIAAAGTGVALFVGPVRSAPETPPLLQSFADFRRNYGGLEPLDAGAAQPNYLAWAAKNFFDNGGTQLFVMRASGAKGAAPAAADYSAALSASTVLRDVSTVAAPGYSMRTDRAEIEDALIAHVSGKAAPQRYRFAVLDPPPGCDLDAIQAARARIGENSRAALYYPWVVVANTGIGTPAEIALPPSGFISGIYARVDQARGVWKAPANEPVQGGLHFERHISPTEEEQLNPHSINCLREFRGRGALVWGARTLTSDREWQYISQRRYFSYLEKSIVGSLVWAMFERNGDVLWGDVRSAITDFLLNEWRAGALLGDRSEKSFFVKCDRTTMTEADLDAGRLICQIGVAILRPSEFTILRIDLRTAA